MAFEKAGYATPRRDGLSGKDSNHALSVKVDGGLYTIQIPYLQSSVCGEGQTRTEFLF
jgi:hypothetical protein